MLVVGCAVLATGAMILQVFVNNKILSPPPPQKFFQDSNVVLPEGVDELPSVLSYQLNHNMCIEVKQRPPVTQPMHCAFMTNSHGLVVE